MGLHWRALRAWKFVQWLKIGGLETGSSDLVGWEGGGQAGSGFEGWGKG